MVQTRSSQIYQSGIGKLFEQKILFETKGLKPITFSFEPRRYSILRKYSILHGISIPPCFSRVQLFGALPHPMLLVCPPIFTNNHKLTNVSQAVEFKLLNLPSEWIVIMFGQQMIYWKRPCEKVLAKEETIDHLFCFLLFNKIMGNFIATHSSNSAQCSTRKPI